MSSFARLTPDAVDFVLLSFEGPDQYAMAGGLGVRMKELALELARQGFRTHLVFVGDPHLPAKESPMENLTLHRWSQWLSAHFPGGVYDGEEAKLIDWNQQLPSFVATELVGPAAAEGRLTAILAEEWHTAYATCQISDHLWDRKLRDKCIILWNANNVMGFDRIDWRRLDFCSQITTVSRYMKHVMWDRGINPLVVPNGIPEDRIKSADPEAVARLRAAFPDRELVFKIGRFSPDKRWNMAIDGIAGEKRRGTDVAMVIRGGIEPHGLEVLANARAQGLSVVDLRPPRDPAEAIEAFAVAPRADVYNIVSFMSDELISLFYSGADAVFANSGHEPFGLVGLEVMGAGGVAFVGSTGEDYAVPYLNSVVLDTDDPAEISIALDYLRANPHIVARLRSDAQETARSFTWENVICDNLLGKLEYVATRQLVSPPGGATSAGPSEPHALHPASVGAPPVAPTPAPTIAAPLARATDDADATAGDTPAGDTRTGEDQPAAAPAVAHTLETTGARTTAGARATAGGDNGAALQDSLADDPPAAAPPIADRASDDPPADLSAAYGGSAVDRHLPVRPQLSEEPLPGGDAPGDPAGRDTRGAATPADEPRRHPAAPGGVQLPGRHASDRPSSGAAGSAEGTTAKPARTRKPRKPAL